MKVTLEKMLDVVFPYTDSKISMNMDATNEQYVRFCELLDMSVERSNEKQLC